LHGENRITEEHVKNNQGVRRVLMESNIYPEELPAEPDIKKLEKQIKKEGERLVEYPAVLPGVESIQ
jgi:DNA-damage-inducible protein D